MVNKIMLTILIRLFARYQKRQKLVRSQPKQNLGWASVNHNEDQDLQRCLKILNRRLDLISKR